MIKSYPSAIIGKDSIDSGIDTIDIIDPSTELVIGKIGNATSKEVDKAVSTARKVFENGVWSKASVPNRQSILREIADVIDKNAEELAHIESGNSGIPLKQARERHVRRAAYNFRFFADYIGQTVSEVYEQNPDFLTIVRREPIGVAALIAPWNAPIALGSMKIAAAIAFGNSCVIKPSEEAPLGVIRLVELINTTDLPSGVVNLVNGDGRLTGDALVRNAGTDLVSFTGGTSTGRAIMAAAAEGLKPVTMELGGKSANIIFEDANLERALDGALLGIFTNNGQQCLAGSRILVHNSIAKDFKAAFVQRAKRIRIGRPEDANTQMGPLASRAHRDRVLGFIEIAKKDGAKVLTGGDSPEEFEKGFYINPIVTEIDSNASQVCQDEIFGPFGTFLTFDTEEEAYRMANDTSFGLVSYVWSENVNRVMRAQEALRSGVVWINTPMMRELRAPFGGYKDSGIGAEGGRACETFYTYAKTVTTPRRELPLTKLGIDE